MKKLLLLLTTTVFLLSCSPKKGIVSQKNVVDVVKYTNTINEASLSKNLHVIASDEMEGRNTGEAGQKKAGLYIIEQYKALGIKNPPGSVDFYQKVPSEFMKKGFSPKLEILKIFGHLFQVLKSRKKLLLFLHIMTM